MLFSRERCTNLKNLIDTFIKEKKPEERYKKVHFKAYLLKIKQHLFTKCNYIIENVCEESKINKN